MRASIRTGPPARRRIFTGLAALSAAGLAVLGIQAPAQAAGPPTAAKTASPNDRIPYESACGAPKKGEFTCFALRRTDTKPVKGLRSTAVTPVGYGPTDLRSAYNLPADGGAGQTVAIVDAFDDPTAEADLAVYRQQYGLPACTTDNGCFTKVDQRGGTDYPVPDEGWAGEISLDLDMVSAIAPNAHILLVEGDDPSSEALGAAVDEAVALGAKYVSNSYGSDYRFGDGEDPSESTTLDADYNHPGVAVVASSGDYAYGVAYPAASQYVTSVGGTSLFRDAGTARGWTETAWDKAGSGCSRYEPKPAFQKDTGCANRAVSDVSAVADLATGVAVYQTYGQTGWQVYGGTSVSAPIIAGVYADAGTPVPGTYPNSYPYATSGAGINDISAGSNGSCSPAYLCTGAAGYDGPTGLGSPDGLQAFRTGPHGELTGTVTDTATGKPLPGATVTAGTDVAHTDAHGSYSLTVPVGTYDIAVTAFGYATGTAQAVAIADGATLTKDFSLAAVPSQTVSGKVTDGSGHGWPLYSKITIDGDPGSVWTDPATGTYQVTLPQHQDFNVHVAAAAPGYDAVSKTLHVGDAPQSADFAMTADPWAATAPGYAVHLTGSTEAFDSTTSAPQGWSVADADGTDGGWEFDDPGSQGNQTGGDGAFAIVDSDHAGWDARQDSQLLSPVYDFTGKATPELAFDTMYLLTPERQTLEVDASDDGGATWTNVWAPAADDTGYAGPARVEVPLTGFAGEPAVQLRFHYTASAGWYWGVDDVFIGQRDYTPTPGGLVVGNATDANTGDGAVGATVTDQDDPAVRATTVATPEDPDIADGFYSLFAPDSGKHTLTGAKPGYVALPKSVKVTADSTVSVPYRLKAGLLKVNPGSIDASVGWGKQATRKLTVKNTGTAPATLKLGEQPGGSQAAAAQGAPLQRIKGDYSPLAVLRSRADTTATTATPSGAPSGQAWQSAPGLPQAAMDNVADSYGGKVYAGFGFTGLTLGGDGSSADFFVLDPVTASWTRLAGAADTREAPGHGFINGKFYVAGGWGSDGNPDPKLEIYDPAGSTWTTGAPAPKPYAGAGSAVLDGKLYMIGGCNIDCGTTDAGVYDPASDSWRQIAAYPEPVSWVSCAGIDGKVYCAGGVTNSGNVKHAYVYDPSADVWSSIADMPLPLWGSAYAAANGLLVISSGISGDTLTNQGFAYDPQTGTWSTLPNANTATYRGGAAVGFYKVGGSTGGITAGAVVENLPGYGLDDRDDAGWLSESTGQLTLQPGASSTVTVTLDSSAPEVTQPGDYSAQLEFGSDTPYVLSPVPVGLHVAPPKTWGTVTGTVYGVTARGGAVPLAGATVRVTGWTASYTLTTDADGHYTLALAAPDNPLTFGVLTDGYQPVVTGVKIKKGTTVNQDFVLRHK